MAETRAAHDWGQTAALLAMIAGFGGSKEKPDFFNPYAKKKPKPKPLPAGIGALKIFLPSDQVKR